MSLFKKSNCVKPILIYFLLFNNTQNALFILPAGLHCCSEDGALFIFSNDISHAGMEES